MRARISRTLVLPSTLPLPEGKYPICAFYTIAPSAINRKTLPEKLSKKLPYYPVPVFLLAQLAVHSSYKGHGLGKITLFKALEYFWQISKYMNAYAVIVDCLNKQAETFYATYGFEKLPTFDNKKRMFLPMETVAKLFR